MNTNNNLSKGGTRITKISYGKSPCLDPNHKAPMHICIPAGYKLEHVCPSCGKETLIKSTEIIY